MSRIFPPSRFDIEKLEQRGSLEIANDELAVYWEKILRAQFPTLVVIRYHLHQRFILNRDGGAELRRLRKHLTNEVESCERKLSGNRSGIEQIDSLLPKVKT